MDEKEAEARPVMGTIFLVLVCVCVCVRACVRACVRECVRACVCAKKNCNVAN